MNLILLAICFLFFCHGPSRHVAKPHDDCAQINEAYEGYSTRDAFVSQYPVAKQRHVLQCLDKRGQ